MENLVISKNWDHKKTFEEICNQTKFAYFFKDGNNLATGDYQYPMLVHKQDDNYLEGTILEWKEGLFYRGDFRSGHGYINEVSKDYKIQIYSDPKKCLKDYLFLLNE